MRYKAEMCAVLFSAICNSQIYESAKLSIFLCLELGVAEFLWIGCRTFFYTLRFSSCPTKIILHPMYQRYSGHWAIACPNFHYVWQLATGY